MIHDLVEILIRGFEVRVEQSRRGLQRWAKRPDKVIKGRGSRQGGETDIISYKGGAMKLGNIITTDSYNHILSL